MAPFHLAPLFSPFFPPLSQVEYVDGLFLAAFSQPANALLWALDCQQQMLRTKWPPELLEHEMCEEITVMQKEEDTGVRRGRTTCIGYIRGVYT